MNHSRYGILIPFSKGVNLFRIARLLVTITSNSHLLISIAFHCVSAITYTSMDYCTSTYTSVDGCISTSTTFSSPMSFYVVYAFTKCYSTTSSFFDFSMNTRSIDVALGFFFFLAHQCCLLLYKKSIANVPIVSIS
jgi:hypothetical protein